MEGFEQKENVEANGGKIKKNPELTSYEEYSRKRGSDGFSKNGGK